MRPLRLLLVEDSDRDAVLLCELMKDAAPDAPPHFVRATRLAEALHRLQQEDFDAVLLDLGLPDGHGVENVERVRNARRDVAVVVLTGLDDDRSAIEALRRGAQEYAVKGRYDGAEMVRVVQHAIERHRVLAEVDSQREQEFVRASHDALTGLANRSLFADRVREAVVQATRRGESLALCFVDLDGFKPVNDRLGHAAGDALLRQVAGALRQVVRDSDTVARVGGDEFAVLLRPVRGVDEVETVAGRMVERIRAIREIEGRAVAVGASIGAALFPAHGSTYEQLMVRADQAMYLAKRSARGGVRVFDGALAPAPAVEPIALVFQPWMDVREGRYEGVEVFVRSGEEKGEAGTLLRRAERSGALAGLGLRVLENACMYWRDWLARGIAPTRFALNVSRSELSEPDFAARWLAVLAAQQVAPPHLQVEVAEDAFDAGDNSVMIENLRRLRAQGVRVILDNFGRQQASLLKLAGLPIDGIKLDIGLIHGLRAGDGVARSVVNGLLDVAWPWRLEVIAIGVEDEGDYRQCRALDCRYQQGYWFSAPQPPERIAELLGAPPAALAARHQSAM
ncbi:MAG: diguanylate cyclase [Gammaproteobacteria bacterium]|nr:diguanylate cyclase [Gammaproteobacteria bacterium]